MRRLKLRVRVVVWSQIAIAVSLVGFAAVPARAEHASTTITIPSITLPPITIPPVLRELLGLITPTTAPAPKPQPEHEPAPALPKLPTRYSSGATGYDISFPECGGAYPPRPFTVAVVGANDGRAFTVNPCLTSEARWAGDLIELYMNINSPTTAGGAAATGPAGRCGAGDDSCLAYNFGYEDAIQTLAAASRDGVHAATWWLDVETAGSCTPRFPTEGDGYWSCNEALNARTIQGAIDALRADREIVGIYSTGYQWGEITGGFTPSGAALATWVPGADPPEAPEYCSPAHSFAGGTTWLVQLWASYVFDHDRAC